MKKELIEAAEGVLAEILEAVDGESPDRTKQITDLSVDLYTTLVEKYRVFLPALIAVAKPAAKDLAPIVATVLTLITEVMSDETFVQAHGDNARVRAKLRKTVLDIYVEAGFTREEAFVLIVSDANAQAMAFKSMQSSSRSSSATAS